MLTDGRMTLADWLEGWLYRGQHHGEFYVVPDSATDEGWRARAWRLADVRVWAVQGGAIWFARRG